MTAPGLDLAAVKARAEAATKGPWEVPANIHGDPYITEKDRGRFQGGGIASCDRRDDYGRSNAEFIAAARTDVPALVAEVERLRKVVAGVEALGRNWLRLSATAMTDEVREWTEASGRSVLERIGATS